MVSKVCAVCGEEGQHRPRADDPSKLRGSCNSCQAACARRWRRERWQRRKAYDTWRGMVRRCHERGTRWEGVPGIPSWRDYGAKGIKVCRRWRDSFGAFLADVGLPPTREATLDRRRCSRNYTPSNVRWVDPATQAANRQNTRWTEAPDPETGEMLHLSLSEWGRRTGIDRRTIGRRLDRGWAPARAVSQPTTVSLELADVPF